MRTMILAALQADAIYIPVVQGTMCRLTAPPVLWPCSCAGHNIEAAWLLADGVDELQAKGAIDSSKAAAMRKALQEIGEAAIATGYDDKNGGM